MITGRCRGDVLVVVLHPVYGSHTFWALAGTGAAERKTNANRAKTLISPSCLRLHLDDPIGNRLLVNLTPRPPRPREPNWPNVSCDFRH
jgi:hypothetical protein